MKKYITSPIVAAGVEAMTRALRRVMQISGIMHKQKEQKYHRTKSSKRYEKKQNRAFKIKKQNDANSKK